MARHCVSRQDRIERMFESIGSLDVMPSHPRDVARVVLGLVDVEAGELDEDSLLERIATWEKLIAWAQAQQVSLIAEFGDRVSEKLVIDGVTVEVVAGEEISSALALGPREARERVTIARQLTHGLWETHDALMSGSIDYSKAALMAKELRGQSPQVGFAVEDEVLPWAPRCSRAQLKRRIDKALIEVDPLEADARFERARSERRVCRPRPRANGMASIFMVLPAADAIAIDACVQAAATSRKASGDSRSMDQLRADAMTSMAQHALATGRIGVVEQAEGGQVVDGGGEVSPVRSVEEFRWGVTRSPAVAISVTVPFDYLIDRVGLAGLDWPQLDGDLVAGDECASERPQSSRRPAQSSKFMGHRQGAAARRAASPPTLDGYGPIPQGLASEIALNPTSIWTRIITDPVTGSVLNVGREKYRPPAGLARHVQIRDGYCVAPRCHVRAINCDLDHTIAFEVKGERVAGLGMSGDRAGGDRAGVDGVECGDIDSSDAGSHASPSGGSTSADNLAPLCRYHHRLKTFAGWELVQESPGHFTWTTPHGQVEHVTGEGPEPDF